MTEQRVAIVTGAGSGIGRATSLLLARSGHRVAAIDLVADRAEATVAEIGPDAAAMAVAADVSSAERMRAAVDQVGERFGQVDVLVTCAGHIQLMELEQLSEEVLDRMLGVHLKGTILSVQAVIPRMAANGYGRIACIASAAAVKPVAAHSHYAAAKAGIIGFARSASRELGPRGITINCVLPGAIDTPLLQYASAEARAQMAANPVGRMGTPEDIAHAVGFLVSPEASFITGTTLLVTGGDYT
jgi:NAD(P)-dependent dehydrogenase (short-subunit alcohol dehydrogenase family)